MSDQDPPSSSPPWGHDPFSASADRPPVRSSPPSPPRDDGETNREPRKTQGQSSLWIIAAISAVLGAGIALAGLWAFGSFPTAASPSTTQPVAASTTAPAIVLEEPSMTGSSFLATVQVTGSEAANGILISPGYVVVPASQTWDTATAIEVIRFDGSSCAAALVGTDRLTQITVLRCDDQTTGEIIEPVDSAFGQEWVATDLLLNREVPASPVNIDQRFVTKDGLRVYGLLEFDQTASNGSALWSADGGWIGMTISPLFRDEAVTPGERLVEVRAALPSQLLLNIAEEIISTGEVNHGAIGVETIDWIERGTFDPAGAEVWTVVTQESLLNRGDVILLVDDHTITSADSLVSRLRFYREGDTVSLTILRGVEQVTFELQLTGTSE